MTCSESSTCSAASADSALGLKEPGCEPLASAKSTDAAEIGSERSGPECRSTGMCAPSRSTPSLSTGRGQLTLFAEASPARTSAQPATQPRRGLRASDPGCGQKCSGLCESADPVGCSLRMWLASELSGLTKCSVTWSKRATSGGRPWYVLQTSAQTTLEHALGSLPTPVASTYGSNRGGAEGRVGQIRPSLRAMMLSPTATANLLAPSMQKWPGVQAFTKLVARFGSGKPALFKATRWLMGYPTTWMRGLPPSETRLSRRSRKSSGAGSSQPIEPSRDD